jgi:hypothetical protein
MKYDIGERDWNNTIQGPTAPAGLYLTRGDGVAVPVTAEMLERWIGLGRGYPLRLDDVAAENILLGVTRDKPLGDPT